jgi:hypothetical protein
MTYVSKSTLFTTQTFAFPYVVLEIAPKEMTFEPYQVGILISFQPHQVGILISKKPNPFFDTLNLQFYFQFAQDLRLRRHLP